MEDYVWKRGEREKARKQMEKINALVDGLVADIKALRPMKDPVQSALEQMLYTANEQYKFLNGR